MPRWVALSFVTVVTASQPAVEAADSRDCFLHTVTHTHGFVHNARSIVSISLAFLSMWLGAVIEVLSSGENVMGAGRGIVGATLDALLGWLVVAVFKRIFYL